MHFDKLFTPLQIGAITAPNRIFMAPMTRARSREPGDVPTAAMAEYYQQRASAGLIITEATQISLDAKGWPGAPGIHTPEQIEAWRRINAGIHGRGGHSAVQVWHTGRMSHSSLRPGHTLPVAASPIASPRPVYLRNGQGRSYVVPAETPHALSVPEIQHIIRDFGHAAAHAREAQFDLIELHGAHGYLIHGFLSPSTNLRTDDYGGNIEKRSRFALEAVDAAIANWDADRVGFRIFPLGDFNGTGDPDHRRQQDAALHLIAELAKRKLAYLHLSEPDWAGGRPFSLAFRQAIREAWPGVIVAAGAYTAAKAEALIEQGLIDAVAFGRDYISNPDLVERLRAGAALAPMRGVGVYGGTDEGYTDYPVLESQS